MMTLQRAMFVHGYPWESTEAFGFMYEGSATDLASIYTQLQQITGLEIISPPVDWQEGNCIVVVATQSDDTLAALKQLTQPWLPYTATKLQVHIDICGNNQHYKLVLGPMWLNGFAHPNLEILEDAILAQIGDRGLSRYFPSPGTHRSDLFRRAAIDVMRKQGVYVQELVLGSRSCCV
jgi:hypothetical protein